MTALHTIQTTLPVILNGIPELTLSLMILFVPFVILMVLTMLMLAAKNKNRKTDDPLMKDHADHEEILANNPHLYQNLCTDSDVNKTYNFMPTMGFFQE